MRKLISFVFILSCVNIKVKAQCDAAFTFSVNLATAQFQATNANVNYRHYWLLGDGTNGFGTGISHTYSFPGTYTVTHILADSVNQCSDTTQQLIGINIPVTCQSNLSLTRDSSNFSLYYFNAMPQVTGDTAMFYYWKIDGISLPLPATTSSFSQVLTPGIHYICLTIFTTTGCTSSLCHTIIVTTPPPCALTASFTYTTFASNSKQFNFTPDPLSNELRYDWNFGDGHSSSLANPVHTYSQAGTYNVRLIITDTIPGCRDSVWQNLQVHGTGDSCAASYTYTANPVHPNQITFTAISNQTITSQTWRIYHWTNSFYDSIIITANNPTYTFTDTGYYYTCLFITTNTGCSNWFCWGLYIDSVAGLPGGRIPSYPNPASNTVNLRLRLEQQNRINITVYNMSGNAVYKTQKQGFAGNNEINIPVQQLNSGQYFIDIQYGNQRKRSIFQKL
ncbi:MAG: PKD domain-containing protein [Bacteroidota bacterium]